MLVGCEMVVKWEAVGGEERGENIRFIQEGVMLRW